MGANGVRELAELLTTVAEVPHLGCVLVAAEKAEPTR